MTPHGSGIGVSSRIEAETERERLRCRRRGARRRERPAAGTSCARRPKARPREALREDMAFLGKLWRAVEEQAERTPAGELVHEDLPLPLRVLRDSSSPDIGRVRVDSEATYLRLKEFAAQFVPHLAPLIELLRRRAADLRRLRHRRRDRRVR